MVVLVLWLAKIFEHDLLALQQRWLPKLGIVQDVYKRQAVAAGMTITRSGVMRRAPLAMRLRANSTWAMLEFVFNGMVFLLLGLQSVSYTHLGTMQMLGGRQGGGAPAGGNIGGGQPQGGWGQPQQPQGGNQFSGGAQSRPQQSAPAAPSNEPPMDFDDDIPF